jgi:alpha-L-rhamnosidase
MPWEFYLHYGARDILEDSYHPMKEYIRYMQTWVNEDGIMFSKRTGRDGKILKWFNLGEWVAPGETVPDEFVHTFYLWKCVDITANVAEILGNNKEAEKYRVLAETTRKAFHDHFYNEELGSYGNGGGNILALRMGVPKNQVSKVIMALKNNIKSNCGHFDTGIFGTRFFFEVLAQHGMQDLAYEALNKREEPSFGHWIEIGSTTTREKWNNESSHNHPMFGGGLVWLYKNLAGIQIDIENPGYRHIIFKPQPVDDLDFVTYSNFTPYGNAGITWRKGNNQFSMEIKVPVSSTATVYIPSESISNVIEGGRSIRENPFIGQIRHENPYTVLTVESGMYQFEVK